jgi:hypothetical protein
MNNVTLMLISAMINRVLNVILIGKPYDYVDESNRSLLGELSLLEAAGAADSGKAKVRFSLIVSTPTHDAIHSRSCTK